MAAVISSLMRFAVFIALCSLVANAHAQDSTQSSHTQVAVSTQQAASTVALAYIGQPRNGKSLSLQVADVEPVTLIDSTTPFLWKLTSSKSAWKVSVKGLAAESWNATATQGLDDLEIYIDSLTGKFIKAVYRIRPLDSVDDPELPASDAEQQIKGIGHSYLEIPNDPPPVGFYDALQCDVSDMLRAKEILIQYVLFTYRFATGEIDYSHPVMNDSIAPRLAWVISLRGIPPLQGRGGSSDYLPAYVRNRYRVVINATTGRPITSGTAPSAHLTPEDRKRIFGK